MQGRIVTQCVFNMDDDTTVDVGTLEFGFNIWKQHKQQVIGFFDRVIYLNETTKEYLYGAWRAALCFIMLVPAQLQICCVCMCVCVCLCVKCQGAGKDFPASLQSFPFSHSDAHIHPTHTTQATTPGWSAQRSTASSSGRPGWPMLICCGLRRRETIPC